MSDASILSTYLKECIFQYKMFFSSYTKRRKMKCKLIMASKFTTLCKEREECVWNSKTKHTGIRYQQNKTKSSWHLDLQQRITEMIMKTNSQVLTWLWNVYLAVWNVGHRSMWCQRQRAWFAGARLVLKVCSLNFTG